MSTAQASGRPEDQRTYSAAPATGGQMPKVTGLKVTDESTESTDSNNVAVIDFKIKLTWNAVPSATHYDIRRFPSGDW